MSDLRTRLVRLAHADPSLRPHLLPILASTAKQAAGGRIALDVVTDATNLTDLGGGNWAVDGICTVNAPGMPATSFRFERFALAHSETSGWTAAVVAAGRQDPLKLALVAAGLEGVVPPSAAESTTKPRLEFEVQWGGGNVVELAMVIGSRGDKLPEGSPAHVYAARHLVADIGRVDLKGIFVKALHLPGVRSVQGPARPTLRDVFVGAVNTGDDRRRVYVRYKLYNKNLLASTSTWKEDLRNDLRRAGVRY